MESHQWPDCHDGVLLRPKMVYLQPDDDDGVYHVDTSGQAGLGASGASRKGTQEDCGIFQQRAGQVTTLMYWPLVRRRGVTCCVARVVYRVRCVTCCVFCVVLCAFCHVSCALSDNIGIHIVIHVSGQNTPTGTMAGPPGSTNCSTMHHCTLYAVRCTLYAVRCTLYAVWFKGSLIITWVTQ